MHSQVCGKGEILEKGRGRHFEIFKQICSIRLVCDCDNSRKKKKKRFAEQNRMKMSGIWWHWHWGVFLSLEMLNFWGNYDADDVSMFISNVLQCCMKNFILHTFKTKKAENNIKNWMSLTSVSLSVAENVNFKAIIIQVIYQRAVTLDISLLLIYYEKWSLLRLFFSKKINVQII